MHIRTLLSEEAATIMPMLSYVHDLHAAAQPERYVTNPDPSLVLAWLSSHIANDGTTCLVAEQDRETAGYLIYCRETRPDHVLVHGGAFVVLDQIAVAPRFQRQGIASALIDEMKLRAAAEGATRVVTKFGAFNHASRALMAANGLEAMTVVAEGAL